MWEPLSVTNRLIAPKMPAVNNYKTYPIISHYVQESILNVRGSYQQHELDPFEFLDESY